MMVDKNKLKSILFSSWSYIVIALVSIGYLATSIFTIGTTGKSLDEILSSGCIYIILGIVMSRLFTNQGTLNGLRDERFMQTVALHAKSVVEVEPYLDKLDDWCEYKTREARKDIRRRILVSRGMKYDTYFDASGDAKGFRPVPLPEEYEPKPDDPPVLEKRKRIARKKNRLDNKEREKCYKKAVRVFVSPLCATTLTSSGIARQDQPFSFGPPLKTYIAFMSMTSVPLRIASALIFSYFGIKLSMDFSWHEFFIKIMQLAIIMGVGVMSMHNAYMYVIEDHRGQIVKKIDYLKMFYASVSVPAGKKTSDHVSERKEVEGNGEIGIYSEIPGRGSDESTPAIGVG